MQYRTLRYTLSFLLQLTAFAQPSCNLTGGWCCEFTYVTQLGDFVHTHGDYGDGDGALTGRTLEVQFTNMPANDPLRGTVSADCGSIAWDSGVTWTRAAPPPSPSPPPAWARDLSILELNALAYTSPAGAGDGSGSGTWASLTQKVPYWADLGITGIWLAYYNLATSHFYGIRSVYAAIDPPVLDPRLGAPTEFAAFVAAAHAAGVRVFCDVIGHGLVNESHYVSEHPEWFNGGSWGMRDYDYTNADFRAWWAKTWTDYVLNFGVDGFRIDIAESAWWHPVWDQITNASAAGGHPIAVWGEGSRYHFSQHDFFAPLNDVPATLAGFLARGAGCLATVQFSCHDSGWESPPGNYFYLQGSRAALGSMGILGPFIPLWLGGDEYDESPVADLPDLQEDLYGKSGKPGGWMYGSVRQWAQLDDHASPQVAMRNDTRALLALRAAHSDVLHHDACAAHVVALPLLGGALPLAPYARYLPGEKAVLVMANTGGAPASVVAATPLAAMGLAGRGFYNVAFLYGGPAGVQRMAEADVASLKATVPQDKVPGGGLAVVLITAAP